MIKKLIKKFIPKKGYGLFGKKEQSLQKLYYTAEKKIIEEVKRQQRLNGDYTNIDKNPVINKILNSLIEQSRKITPNMVKEQFIIGRKKANIKSKKIPYNYDISLEELSEELQGKVIASTLMIKKSLQGKWRQCLKDNKNDIEKASEQYNKNIESKGITAFVDKVGKQWNLKSYFGMASKTISLQATNLGTLSDDWDLYKMTSHPTSCPICRPYQGRVYSKSGTNKKYPPLASIFGKIDPNGPDVLENTYLCIHPNCQHRLIKFKESGLSKKQLQTIQRQSSFATNPSKIPKKNQQQINSYRKQLEYEKKMKKEYDKWLKKQEKNLEKNIKFNIELSGIKLDDE